MLLENALREPQEVQEPTDDFSSTNPLIRLRRRMRISQRDFSALLGYPWARYRILESGYWPILPDGVLAFLSKRFPDESDQEASDRLDIYRMSGRQLNQEQLEEAAALAEKGREIAASYQADWKAFRAGLSREFLNELHQQLYPYGQQNGMAV
jgi:hypothetical protein